MISDEDQKKIEKLCYDLFRMLGFLFFGIAALFALLNSWGQVVLNLFLGGIFYGLYRLTDIGQFTQ